MQALQARHRRLDVPIASENFAAGGGESVFDGGISRPVTIGPGVQKVGESICNVTLHGHGGSSEKNMYICEQKGRQKQTE